VWVCAAVAAAQPVWAQTPAPAEPPAPVDVVGATQITYDGATEQYMFRGPQVVVTQGDRRLVSTVVLYNGKTRRAELPEGGTVSGPTAQLTADHIVAELNTRHLTADGHAQGRFLDEGEWAQFAADEIDVRDDPDHHDVHATGHVVGVRADEELRADAVAYDRTTRIATATGAASLTRGGDHLQADAISANLGTNDAEANGHVVLDRADQHLHAVADHATYAGGTETAVLTGHSAVTRDRDVVNADKITMDLAKNRAYADGSATLVAYPRGEGQSSPP
jgi:lipopolysaccharide transport protein LptA